jgi:predicted SAM-dependent methyltransferase
VSVSQRVAGTGELNAPRLFERVRLVTIQPNDYPHSAAFAEIVATFAAGFEALGSHVDKTINQPLIGEGINIIFGAHLIAAGYVLPANTIIFNLEQMSRFVKLQPHYMEFLKRFTVLDYSERNAAVIRERTGNEHIHVCKIGYVPALTRIANAAKPDVDILFYGVINDRRRKILDALAANGLVVRVLTGVYGSERDSWIARSKIVLNVHHYGDHIHELVRSSYLLANHKAIVSECDDDTEIDDDIRTAIVGVPYDRIVATCMDLIRDDARRRAIEQSAFKIFSHRDHAKILGELLPQLSRELPRRINLGSGKAFDAQCLNIDIDSKWNPDVVGDIAAGSRRIFFSRRFGLVRLDDDQFDEITTTDVLEHIPDLVAMMTRCLELLGAGGVMRIVVPYDLSWGAWQDPTHVRAFNERSWMYYTDWFWYLGWVHARFVMTDMKMSLSPVGDALLKRGMANEEIFRTPRAVDSMQVILTKRLLNDQEKEYALAWQKGSESPQSTP